MKSSFKKVFISIGLLSLPLFTFAQWEDDVYFSPKQSKSKKAASTEAAKPDVCKTQSTQTVVTVSQGVITQERDVDEYNRRTPVYDYSDDTTIYGGVDSTMADIYEDEQSYAGRMAQFKQQEFGSHINDPQYTNVFIFDGDDDFTIIKSGNDVYGQNFAPSIWDLAWYTYGPSFFPMSYSPYNSWYNWSIGWSVGWGGCYGSSWSLGWGWNDPWYGGYYPNWGWGHNHYYPGIVHNGNVGRPYHYGSRSGASNRYPSESASRSSSRAASRSNNPFRGTSGTLERVPNNNSRPSAIGSATNGTTVGRGQSSGSSSASGSSVATRVPSSSGTASSRGGVSSGSSSSRSSAVSNSSSNSSSSSSYTPSSRSSSSSSSSYSTPRSSGSSGLSGGGSGSFGGGGSSRGGGGRR